MTSTWNALSGPTQLVGMALEGAVCRRLLVALPVEPGLPELLARSFAGPHLLYHDYAVYRQDRHHTTDATLEFAASCQANEGPFDLAAVYLPKGKALVELVLSAVSAVLEPDATVFVVGPKRSAIRSSRPLVEKYIGDVRGTRSARHCVLVEACKGGAAAPFEGTHVYTVGALGREVHVVSLPGVFSHGRLDEGTALLAEHVGTISFRTALDWGCGAGVIGTALELARPDATVDLVDSNVMAVEAARRTLAANGLDPARVRASDVFSDVTGRYDLIVANPPFHTGLAADFATTEQFIAEAGGHLTPTGRLVIVANRFIDYLKRLRRHFRSVRVLAENTRYRVIEAANVRRRSDGCRVAHSSRLR